MPTLTYDGQSFSWNGRRLWLVGVNLEYALLARERWHDAIASLRQMGFNTIRASVPWCLHEVRRGRFDFAGGLDLAAFARECRAQGMHLVLRIGPVVGEPFDGGGLPAWLASEPGAKPRQVNDVYLRRVSELFRAIAEQVAPLQATMSQSGGAFAGSLAGDGGPLVAVQVEHAWTCGNETAGASYFAELLRFARECGFTVPVLTANGLWVSAEGCIEVWEGWNDLFAHLRQLQSVQAGAPRLVEIREEAARAAGMGAAMPSNGSKRGGKSGKSVISEPHWSIGMDFLSRMGQILAAGGQPILPGVQRTDRSNAVPALLDAGGRPDPALRSLRRMVSFANHFGHVYADADATAQTTVQAPDALQPGGFSVVVVEGRAGRVNFVFRGPDGAQGERHDATTLITKEGGRLQVELGDAPVGWYLFDVSLHGRATLDWCNVSPFALIDRSILVLQGPAGARCALSIDGGELTFTLPEEGAGAKPVVLQHQGMVIVGCNQTQIDATVVEGRALVVGAERVLADGAVELASGFSQAVRVSRDGKVSVIGTTRAPRKPALKALEGWLTAGCDEYTHGTSDRFATLHAPASLAGCGAYDGWGWYRLQWKNGKGDVLLPGAAGLMHGWLDGKPMGVLSERAMPLKISAGQHSLAALVKQGGRSAAAASAGEATGLSRPMHVVNPLSMKASVVEAPTLDPFKASEFIQGYAPGRAMAAHAAKFVFQQRGKEPIVLDAPGEAVHALVVLNGKPHRVIDWTGAIGDALVLDMAVKATPKTPARHGLQAGANELLLIPFHAERAQVERLAKGVRMFASVQVLDAGEAKWSFAKWQPPAVGSRDWSPVKSAKTVKAGEPRWFMACFEGPKGSGEAGARAVGGKGTAAKGTTPTETDAPIELLCTGLGRGHVFVNGELVGGYDLPAGRDTVTLPAERLGESNTLVIFDAEGQMPVDVRIRR